MKTKILDILLKRDEDSDYINAKSSIDRVCGLLSKITVDLPDVSSQDIYIVKNKWVEISKDIGEGVHSMGLHESSEYNSMLLHYTKGGWMYPHFHSKEWEVIMILDGTCIDKETGERLNKGDIYIIPRNTLQHIVAEDSECYMYIMFSHNRHNLKITESDKHLANQLIGNRHSFKAEIK